MTSSPTLLVITNNRFWRGSIGSQMRIASLLAHLQRQGWQVSTVFSGRRYAEDEAGLRALGDSVWFSQPPSTAASDLQVTPSGRSQLSLKTLLRRSGRWLRALAGQFGRRAPRPGLAGWLAEVGLRSREPKVSDFVDARALALARRLVAETPPHAVLVEYVFQAWAIDALRPLLPSSTLCLLDTHDVLHERQQRFHALGEQHAIDISAREEAAWLSKFDAVLAIQSQDAAKFRGIGVQSRVLTVMHPLPAAAVPAAPGGVVGIGFIGSTMAPNTLALQELLAGIWPQVQQAVGERARLVVAGSVCGSVAVWPAGVVSMGFLDSVDDFYRAVDIVVSPLRIGGGLKIKNVEALCKGKALVTTPIGAEGLDDAGGHAFLVVESQHDLVNTLQQLVVDALRRERLAVAGLQYATAAFSEDAVYAELDSLLAPLLAGAATASACC